MSYDTSNKVTSILSEAKDREQVNYDGAGRPIAYKDPAGNLTRELSYGYADKVVKVNNVNHEAEFFYNAEGQLVGSSLPGKATSYAWDGNVLAAEGDEGFTNEAHVTGGLPMLNGDQEVMVSDYLGNTLSQGNAKFNGTAYGEGLEKGRFTGKPYVKELAAYVFMYRNYSSSTYRWNLTDPSGFPDGQNQHLYANNDPLLYIDSLGLSNAPATYNWSPSIPQQVTGVIATFTGTFTWSVVKGNETSSISVQPGWSGPQYYRGRTVSHDPDDTTSWTPDSTGKYKRYEVKQHIYIKETDGAGTVNLLKDISNTDTGVWIEI